MYCKAEWAAFGLCKIACPEIFICSGQLFLRHSSWSNESLKSHWISRKSFVRRQKAEWRVSEAKWTKEEEREIKRSKSSSLAGSMVQSNWAATRQHIHIARRRQHSPLASCSLPVTCYLLALDWDVTQPPVQLNVVCWKWSELSHINININIHIRPVCYFLFSIAHSNSDFLFSTLILIMEPAMSGPKAEGAPRKLARARASVNKIECDQCISISLFSLLLLSLNWPNVASFNEQSSNINKSN